MIHRMMNPTRILVLLASVKRAINTHDFIPFRNAYPQITRANHLHRGFQPRNYSAVVSASAVKAKVEEVAETSQIYKILKEKEWCKETEEELNGISEITEEDVTGTLKILKNPEKSLSLFSWYSKHSSYKPSSAVYNALLKAVARKDSMQNFWKVAEEMKGHGFLMELEVFTYLSTKIWRHRMSEELTKLFIWMTENGEEKPSALKCYDLLHCISKSPNPNIDTAQRAIEAFKSCGGTMERRIYIGLHRCLTKTGRFDEAQKLVDTMANEGLAADNYIYGQLIYGLCNANRLEEARNVFDEMQKKGCNPNSVTWAILIKGHCMANETDRALALYEEMVEKGCEIHSPFLQVIVSHFCNQDRVMDAYNLMLKAVEERKAKPPYATYTEIITKLCNSGMPKEACKMFDLMKDHGFLAPVQLIYDVIVKCGTADDAYDFIKMVNKDAIFGRACSIMVKAFCNAERLSEAREFVSKVPTDIAKRHFLLTIIRKASGDDSAKSEVPTEDGADAGNSPPKKRYRKRKAKKGGIAEKDAGKDELKDESKEVHSADAGNSPPKKRYRKRKAKKGGIAEKDAGKDELKDESKEVHSADAAKSPPKKRNSKRKGKKGGNTEKDAGKDELKDEWKEDHSVESKVEGCT